VRESWKTTDSAPPLEAMSGKNWCPAATLSSGAAGVDQESPSGEFRAKIFACPSSSLALQTTCTPSASAATAERLEKRA
jgi:hypothetical protein